MEHRLSQIGYRHPSHNADALTIAEAEAFITSKFILGVQNQLQRGDTAMIADELFLCINPLADTEAGRWSNMTAPMLEGITVTEDTITIERGGSKLVIGSNTVLTTDRDFNVIAGDDINIEAADKITIEAVDDLELITSDLLDIEYLRIAIEEDGVAVGFASQEDMDAVEAVLASNDNNLNTIQKLVDYIKFNRQTILTSLTVTSQLATSLANVYTKEEVNGLLGTVLPEGFLIGGKITSHFLKEINIHPNNPIVPEEDFVGGITEEILKAGVIKHAPDSTQSALSVGYPHATPEGYHRMTQGVFFTQANMSDKSDSLRMIELNVIRIIENDGTEAFTLQSVEGIDMQVIEPGEAYLVYDNGNYRGVSKLFDSGTNNMLKSQYVDQFGLLKPNYMPRANYNPDTEYIEKTGASFSHSLVKIDEMAQLAKQMVEKYTPAQKSALIIGNKFEWNRSDALPDFLIPLNGQTINNANLQQPELWAERKHSTLLTYDDQAHSITLKNYNNEGRFARAGTTAGKVQQDTTAKNGLVVGINRGGAHTHTFDNYNNQSGAVSGGPVPLNYDNNGQGANTSRAGDHTHSVSISSNDTETRPVNVSEIWCVIAKA